MKRKALGKGLDALLPSAPEEGTPALVDIDLLCPNPNQPRQRFTPEALEELAASIRENGIIQPIVVRRKEDLYEIIAGERRWRAAQLAELLKVPVVIMEVADDRMLELALLENIQRENLNPVEEAQAYHLLIEAQGMTHEELSRRLGKSRTAITNSIRLLQLSPVVKEAIETGRLTAGQARPLLAVGDLKLQQEMAEAVIRRGLSAREVEKLVSRMKESPASAVAQEKKDPNVVAAEERLTRRLATKVRIMPGKTGGVIHIQYSSGEELDRLYELLNRPE